MAEAYIVDAVRAPVGRRGGGPGPRPPRRPRRPLAQGVDGPHGCRPRRGRGRDLRLCRHHRPPGRRHRPHGLAGRRPARGGPRHHVDRQCGSSQQAVHFAAQAVMSGTTDLVVAGGVQNMSDHPHQLGDDGGRARGLHRPRPVPGLQGLGGPLRRPGGQPVPGGRDDRREVGHLPRGHGGLRLREPPAGHPGHRRGPLRGRDRAAGRRRRTTRAPAASRRSRRWRPCAPWSTAAG